MGSPALHKSIALPANWPLVDNACRTCSLDCRRPQPLRRFRRSPGEGEEPIQCCLCGHLRVGRRPTSRPPRRLARIPPTRFEFLGIAPPCRRCGPPHHWHHSSSTESCNSRDSRRHRCRCRGGSETTTPGMCTSSMLAWPGRQCRDLREAPHASMCWRPTPNRPTAGSGPRDALPAAGRSPRCSW
jgi:hypothetical protein